MTRGFLRGDDMVSFADTTMKTSSGCFESGHLNDENEPADRESIPFLSLIPSIRTVFLAEPDLFKTILV